MFESGAAVMNFRESDVSWGVLVGEFRLLYPQNAEFIQF